MKTRSSLFSLFAASLIGLCALSNVHAINYYVSPTGSDNANGTQTAPFLTIGKARDAAKSLGTLAEDVNIYLRGGWYYQSIPLAFDQTHSGTGGHNVIYQAYPAEYPVISGGRQITGWILYNATKNIWKAPAAGLNTRQLYVNCVRAQRAHSSLKLFAFIRTTGLRIYDTTMQHWRNPGDVEMVWKQASGSYWTERRCGVVSISDTLITLKQPGWNNARGSGNQNIATGPSDVENAYELLDEPGEWYLDRTAGMVYYIPRPTDNMATARVIAPVLESLVSLVGTLDNPVNHIQFKGITFAHATYMKPSTNAGFPELQTNNWNNSVPLGNVTLQAAQNIQFERCVFTHLGGAGIYLYGGAKNNVMIGCVFADISANMIQIGTSTDPARSDTRSRDSGNQIVNCYIHDGPSEYHGGAAICAFYVSDLLISHNEICRNPLGSICIGWGWSGSTNYPQNNAITYNKIHDNNIYVGIADVGPIYTLSAQPNSIMRGNYIYRGSGPGALYLDQGTAFYDVDSNVCRDPSRENINGVISQWTFQNTGSHDNNWHNNYTDYNVPDVNGSVYGTPAGQNFYVSNGVWPAPAVAIMNKAGIESAYQDVLTMPCGCSMLMGDMGSIPVALNARVLNDAQHVQVTFSEPVDPVSAASIANYQIDNNVAVTSAVLSGDFKQVVLGVSGNLENYSYQLTINNVKNIALPSRTIAPNTMLSFSGLGKGLIGWWKFDEGTGKTTADASGYGRNATVSHDTMWITAGRFGKALKFSSFDSNKVVIPSEALGTVAGAKDFTLTMWLFPKTYENRGIFTSGNKELQLRLKVHDFYAVVGTAGTKTGVLDNYHQFEQRWQNVALVKNGNAAKLYLNGVCQSTWTASEFSAQSLILGVVSAASGVYNYFGSMDDVRLYNRALGDGELLTITDGYIGPAIVPVAPRNKPVKTNGLLKKKVEIFNTQGALIKIFNVVEWNDVKSMHSLPKGIYVVVTSGNGWRSVQKTLVAGRCIR